MDRIRSVASALLGADESERDQIARELVELVLGDPVVRLAGAVRDGRESAIRLAEVILACRV